MNELLIRSIRPPAKKNIDDDLEWFCRSLGLLGKRDTKKTGLKIFKLLLDAAKNDKLLRVEEIAEHLNMTRAAAIHHLKTMESAGLISRRDSTFELRMRNLHALVDEMEKDMMRTFENVRKIAEDIDKELGMPVRSEYEHRKKGKKNKII